MNCLTLGVEADVTSQAMMQKRFTNSSNEDVTAALTNLFTLMFARTGAPNPIDES